MNAVWSHGQGEEDSCTVDDTAPTSTLRGIFKAVSCDEVSGSPLIFLTK